MEMPQQNQWMKAAYNFQGSLEPKLLTVFYHPLDCRGHARSQEGLSQAKSVQATSGPTTVAQKAKAA